MTEPIREPEPEPEPAPERLPFPWEPEPLTGERLARMTAAFPDYREDGLACHGPSQYVALPDSKPFFEEYYNTPVHPGDIWIVTLPKCGERHGHQGPAVPRGLLHSPTQPCPFPRRDAM